MKNLITLFLIASYLTVSAQQIKIDTVINTGIYKSYFNYSLKEPLYVTYTLYKGGGDCTREALTFKECGIKSASDQDYAGNSFDKGHLANAEDFANDCDNEAKTFCYYNCVPQTKK